MMRDRSSFFRIPARTRAALGIVLVWAAPLAQGQADHAAPASDQAHQPNAYVRVEDDGRLVRLMIGAREFESGALGGPRVALVGAVHIGQREYYEALQQYMSRFDVVLFEGVGGGPHADPAEADPERAVHEPAAETARQTGAPKGVQARLAEALGLEFQLDGIDYTGPTWRNSDMTIEEIRAELAASPAGSAAGEQIFGALAGRGMSARMTNLILGFVEKSDVARQAARVFMIDILEMSDELMLSMPGGMGDLMRVLIVDRNEKVLADLGEITAGEPEIRSIAIFYGAGHLLDMEASLVERFKYTPGETSWFTAIEADLGEGDGSISAMRSMIRSSMQMQLEMMRRAAESAQGGDAPRRDP